MCQPPGVIDAQVASQDREVARFHIVFSVRLTSHRLPKQALDSTPASSRMRYAHLSPEVKQEAVKVLDMPAPAPSGAQAGHIALKKAETA